MDKKSKLANSTRYGYAHLYSQLVTEINLGSDT